MRHIPNSNRMSKSFQVKNDTNSIIQIVYSWILGIYYYLLQKAFKGSVNNVCNCVLVQKVM